MLLGSCQPTAQSGRNVGSSTLPPLASYAALALPATSPDLAMVGRSDFDRADLSDEQRLWYDRLIEAIDASRDDMLDRAASDDTYRYGRWLFQYDAALLLALRTTGDLRFLDEVDVVAQAMRAELSDGWCGGVRNAVDVNVRYGRVVEPDGFRNFRLRGEDGRDYCRDTGDLNETLTHGHLALVMYAYHVNRHLQSPAGIDYGERADFWLDYLRNDFEAKWRERSGTTWPEMDFISLKFCHTYTQMLLYYHFVGQRLASDGSAEADPYLRQTMRLTDGMFDVPYVPGDRPGGFIDVDTPLGPAVVYSFGAPGGTDVSSVHLEACPVTYARYMLTSVLTMHLENVPGWDDAIMNRLATGLAHFVVGDDVRLDVDEPFAAGVSGSSQVAGLPATEYRGDTSLTDFSLSPFAAYAPWDASGRLAQAAEDVYRIVEDDEDQPERVFIPAGMLYAVTADAEAE